MYFPSRQCLVTSYQTPLTGWVAPAECRLALFRKLQIHRHYSSYLSTEVKQSITMHNPYKTALRCTIHTKLLRCTIHTKQHYDAQSIQNRALWCTINTKQSITMHNPYKTALWCTIHTKQSITMHNPYKPVREYAVETRAIHLSSFNY